jgi:hypothetical protein
MLKRYGEKALEESAKRADEPAIRPCHAARGTKVAKDEVEIHGRNDSTVRKGRAS